MTGVVIPLGGLLCMLALCACDVCMDGVAGNGGSCNQPVISGQAAMGTGDMVGATSGGTADMPAPVSPVAGSSPAATDAAETPAEPFTWDLPPGFPAPKVPEDNPMNVEKVELGRYLFYDKRLSDNETYSCGNCHQQALAFTDGRVTSLGSTGQDHPRSAMMLGNVAYASTLTWANPLMMTLERQATVPEFGDTPLELALKSIDQIEARLQEVPLYQEMFPKAFPGEDEPITANNMNKAIAAFERTLISGRSPFDRYYYDGDEDAISEAAKRGYEAFNAHPFECFHCHTGFNFSDQTTWEGKAVEEVPPFHNTGLYNIDRRGSYPEPNTGVYSVTGVPQEMGRFKAPSLRNVAVTGPYMHDGSIATLREVVDHYAAGGRTITEGPYAGNGSLSPLKDTNVPIPTVEITEQQRNDVVAFLESLTDEGFLTNPAFSDPWAKEETGGATSETGGATSETGGATSETGGETPSGPATRHVVVRFKGMVGDSDFVCGQTYPDQGSTGVTVSADDLKFYVQDLKLVTEDGEEVPVQLHVRDPWQTETLALVDLENGEATCEAAGGTAEMNAEITGMVPEGVYTGISFVNGVPEEVNHGDPTALPAPLQAGGMHWSWLAGFRFMRAQLAQVVGPEELGGVGVLHPGSTQCSGTPARGFSCAKPNRNLIRLDGFDPDLNTIVVDIGALFAQSDLSKEAQCHGTGDACVAPMAQLGIDYETGEAMATQAVYRVE